MRTLSGAAHSALCAQHAYPCHHFLVVKVFFVQNCLVAVTGGSPACVQCARFDVKEINLLCVHRFIDFKIVNLPNLYIQYVGSHRH